MIPKLLWAANLIFSLSKRAKASIIPAVKSWDIKIIDIPKVGPKLPTAAIKV